MLARCGWRRSIASRCSSSCTTTAPTTTTGSTRSAWRSCATRQSSVPISAWTWMSRRPTLRRSRRRCAGTPRARSTSRAPWPRRSGKNRIRQRVISEARAGRYEVDVIHNPSPEMEALHSEKLLKAVDSPLHAKLIPQAVARHREWAGPRVYIFVQAYNTRLVSKAELPKTYVDLLEPRWKGRIAIEGKEQEWFYTVVQAMGEAEVLRLFRKLAAN